MKTKRGKTPTRIPISPRWYEKGPHHEVVSRSLHDGWEMAFYSNWVLYFANCAHDIMRNAESMCTFRKSPQSSSFGIKPSQCVCTTSVKFSSLVVLHPAIAYQCSHKVRPFASSFDSKLRTCRNASVTYCARNQ